MSMIKLAVVDDSSFVRKAIERIMSEEQRIKIVGMAASGEELINNLDRWSPDVITLDLSMPGMGGLLTLDKIMAQRPTPVIILSTHSAKDAPLTIESLHRGAVDFIDKQQYSLVDFDSLRTVLIEKILQVTSCCSLPVHKTDTSKDQCVYSRDESSDDGEKRPSIEAVLIGASTGGPPVIQEILENIKVSLRVPIAVVQHMPEGFTRAFAERLNSHLEIPVLEARHGELFLPGAVYIAPAGSHLTLKKKNGYVFTSVSPYPDSLPHRPSVDVLFKSAVPVYAEQTLAILCTGMGRDGADGMVQLAKAGAYTIAQDEYSCVVYGMPKAAVELGAVNEILNVHRIGERILSLVNQNKL
jgi:two-component system, chemotaxis family, protein-glutamate methylesterase/glutaminase